MTTITDLLQDLEAKAKRATSGRVVVLRDEQLTHGGLDVHAVVHTSGVVLGWFTSRTDAEHFAACSPDRILALVEWAQQVLNVLPQLVGDAQTQANAMYDESAARHAQMGRELLAGHLDAEGRT